MKKLVLMSIIIMTIVIPIRASKARTTAQGLRSTLKGIAIYCFIYLLLLLFVYPRLS